MTDTSWMPRPGPQHARLKEGVGVWDVACTYFMGPDQPPMTVKARETVEMLGEFWAIGRFESKMMGMPFVGHVIVGYDTARGRYVGSWVDTMMPYYFLLEGDFDSAGRVLTMTGRGGDAMSGGMIEYKTTEEMRPDGSRLFEMFRLASDGSEIKMFSYIYTRAKAAPKKSAKAPAGPAKTSAKAAPKKGAKAPAKKSASRRAKPKPKGKTGKKGRR